VTIYVHDIDFEPGRGDDKDKYEVGFQAHRNMKLVDIASLEDPHLMRISLRNAKSTECVRILVQNQHDDEFFGSISINISKYFLGPSTLFNHPYKQWLTLFDDPEDDEYDGNLGEDDEDFPKILVTLTVLEDEKFGKAANYSASEFSPNSKPLEIY
jgi:hypothetical protein